MAPPPPIPPPAPVMTQTFPSRRPLIEFLALRGDVDALDFRIALQRVHAELPAEARLLEAAERRRDAHGRVRVDAQHAALERARHAERASTVARPDRAGETIRRVIRDPDRVSLVLERDDRRDRAEHFFAGDTVVVRGLDERAREPEAGAVWDVSAEKRLALDEA